MSARPRNPHPFLVWTLIVLGSVVMLVSVLTMWVDRQMLDNASWKQASRDLIQDPQVQSALSVYLVDQLYANVDLAGQLEQKLPEQTKPLAAPLVAAMRQPATQGVQRLLANERVQNRFVQASAAAHQRLVNVLEDKTGYGISTGNGVVTLNLAELVREVGADFGVPASALDKLPAETGVITVMKSDQLSAAQTGVQVVRALSIWLLVLVLVLYGAAIWLARGARRGTLRNVGWAFVVVSLVVLVVRRVVGSYAIGALASAEYRDVADRVWLIGSEILGQIGRAGLLYGLVAVLGAALAGPTRPAVAIRRRLDPVLAARPDLTWTAFGLVFLLLVLWGPTYALRTWWGVLLFGGLLALGVEALRRQAKTELVAAPAPAAAGGASVGALVARVRPRGGDGATAAPPRSLTDELDRLRDLHDAGVITDEEFERGKRLVLT